MMTRPYGPIIGYFLGQASLEGDHSDRAVAAGGAVWKFLRLGRPAAPLRVGDRFCKAHDRFGTVWEVMRIWKTVDGLLHVRLRGLGGLGETRIISAVTLTDSAYFLQVPSAEE